MSLGDYPNNIAAMHQHELDRLLNELDRQGRRKEVVALLRKYGLFSDEAAVAEYLAGEGVK